MLDLEEGEHMNFISTCCNTRSIGAYAYALLHYPSTISDGAYAALRPLYASLRYTRPFYACGTPCKTCNGTLVTCGCLTAIAVAVGARWFVDSRIETAKDVALH